MGVALNKVLWRAVFFFRIPCNAIKLLQTDLSLLASKETLRYTEPFTFVNVHYTIFSAIFQTAVPPFTTRYRLCNAEKLS
jgi:hypothetical protein